MRNLKKTYSFYIKKSRSIPVALLFASLALILQSCFSATTRDGTPLNSIRLPDYGITLYYPDDWEVVGDDYFDFKAIGLGSNDLPASLEYRGLLNDGRDQSRMDQYATGWFLGIAQSYPGWEYVKKDKTDAGDGTVYEFEGTYRVATDVYRKIGRLRFTEKRIHAVYFTAYDRNFEVVRPSFDDIYQKMKFFEPEGEIPDKAHISPDEKKEKNEK